MGRYTGDRSETLVGTSLVSPVLVCGVGPTVESWTESTLPSSVRLENYLIKEG